MTGFKKRVLIIAGSDPSGGAGIQADIKTVTAMEAYAASAITALTAQNTLGVTGIEPVKSTFIAEQINAVLSDIGADCVKIGMLHDTDVIETVFASLQANNYKGALVVDPVMVATSGDRLLKEKAVDAMKDCLFKQATIITPNIREAEVLTGLSISSVGDMRSGAEFLLKLGPKAVCMKGGHLEGETLTDLLITSSGDEFVAESKRLNTKHTHGTGCSFASGVAAELSKGENLEDAFYAAHAFVYEAIKAAPNLGAGNGPLGHAYVRS